NTVVSALLGALLMSFTWVPVVRLSALRRPKTLKDSPVLTWAKRAYQPTLRAALLRPETTLVLALGALVAGIVLIPRLGSEFLPELNEGSLYVTYTLPATMSLTDARKLTPRIKTLLRRTPEVDSLLTQLGRPEDGTDPTLTNNLEIFVKLKPLDKWRPRKPTHDELTAEMTQNRKEIPGIEYNFSQPIRDNVNENISGQFGQIAVKIYGDDLDTLQALANKAEDAIALVPGVADLGIVKASASPAISVKLDRKALGRCDLDMADVPDYVRTALGGHTAPPRREGTRKFDVVVGLPPARREDGGAIRQLRLPLKDGSLVPLSAIADTRVDMGRAAITRENGKRYIGIRMNVRNRD